MTQGPKTVPQARADSTVKHNGREVRGPGSDPGAAILCAPAPPLCLRSRNGSSVPGTSAGRRRASPREERGLCEGTGWPFNERCYCVVTVTGHSDASVPSGFLRRSFPPSLSTGSRPILGAGFQAADRPTGHTGSDAHRGLG